MARLTQGEFVTIQVLASKKVPQRQIAGQLGVTEGTVRCQLAPRASGAQDGRRGKPRKV